MGELQLIGLFIKAPLLVKGVIALLLGFSVFSWGIIFQQSCRLHLALQQSIRFENRFWSGINLNRLYQDLTANSSSLSGCEQLFYVGFKEYSRLQVAVNGSSAELIEGITRVMRVTLSRELEKLERHGSLLATIASVSPYIGLVGTVWGILQAFIALGSVQHATLQMVAPSIAEALITTALGLLVAIPALIAYNYLMSFVRKIEQNHTNFMEEFIAIVHRQWISTKSNSQSVN